MLLKETKNNVLKKSFLKELQQQQLKYCSIPILVNNHLFHLLISSFDVIYIHYTCLIQSKQPYVLKYFINKENQFKRRYYKPTEFPIEILKKLHSFSFVDFKGYFKEKWFENNKLQWFNEDDLMILEPEFISVPLSEYLTPLYKIKNSFSFAFTLSNDLSSSLSSLRFILMENMEMVEEMTINYNLNLFYCHFSIPYNKLNHQMYLRIIIKLIDHTSDYLDGGCYIFDEQGLMVKEKEIGLTKRRNLPNLSQLEDTYLSKINKKINGDNERNEIEEEIEEDWYKFAITLHLTDYDLSFANQTTVFDKDGVIYENGIIHKIGYYSSVKNVIDGKLLVNPLINHLEVHNQCYFQTENKLLLSESVINHLLFGDLFDLNEKLINQVKTIQLDESIDEELMVEIIKRRFCLLETQDLECCRNVLLCVRKFCDYGENMLLDCYEWLYDKIVSNQIDLSLLDLILFSSSDFIEFSISLFQITRDDALLHNLNVLMIYIISIKEKHNEILQRLTEIFCKPENYEYLYKFMWLLLEKFDHVIPFMDKWVIAFNKSYQLHYPNRMIPSLIIVDELKRIIENPNLIFGHRLIHPFNSIPFSIVSSRKVNKSLEKPVIITFTHEDNSQSTLLFKQNKTVIESQIMTFMEIVSDLCNSSYTTYQIFNILNCKFVEFIPDCIPYLNCKTVIPELLLIPKLTQLNSIVDIHPPNPVINEFQTVYDKYIPTFNFDLQPQYERKQHFIESGALLQIFWCLCSFIDRHPKNVLFNPLNGCLFHIDLTFARTTTTQYLSPLQYFITEGYEKPFQAMHLKEIVQKQIQDYLHIIFQNKGKLSSFLSCIRRSNALQIDTICGILYLSNAQEMISENKRMFLLQRVTRKMGKNYNYNTNYK